MRDGVVYPAVRKRQRPIGPRFRGWMVIFAFVGMGCTRSGSVCTTAPSGSFSGTTPVSEAAAARYFPDGVRSEQRRKFAGHLLLLEEPPLTERVTDLGGAYRVLDATGQIIGTGTILVQRDRGPTWESKRETASSAAGSARNRFRVDVGRMDVATWAQIDWCFKRWFWRRSPLTHAPEDATATILIEGLRDGAYQAAEHARLDVQDPLPERRGIAQCVRLLAMSAGVEFKAAPAACGSTASRQR